MIKTTLRRLSALSMLLALMLGSTSLHAEKMRFLMDTKNAHAFIQFKVSHLGFSWLLGRFNDFEGEFTLDSEDVEKSTVKVTIDVASLDTNHVKRDKHLRSGDFFDVTKFPKSTFVSTKVEKTGENTAKVTGDFTLKGITKPVVLEVTHIGGGADPFGMSVRQGFEATARIPLKEFGITYKLPNAEYADIYISAEGIQQLK